MKLLTLALLLFGSFWASSQEAVELIESTLKLGISEEKNSIVASPKGDNEKVQLPE